MARLVGNLQNKKFNSCLRFWMCGKRRGVLLLNATFVRCGHGSGMFHLFSQWRILEKQSNIALLDAVIGCHIRRISRGE